MGEVSTIGVDIAKSVFHRFMALYEGGAGHSPKAIAQAKEIEFFAGLHGPASLAWKPV